MSDTKERPWQDSYIVEDWTKSPMSMDMLRTRLATDFGFNLLNPAVKDALAFIPARWNEESSDARYSSEIRQFAGRTWSELIFWFLTEAHIDQAMPLQLQMLPVVMGRIVGTKLHVHCPQYDKPFYYQFFNTLRRCLYGPDISGANHLLNYGGSGFRDWIVMPEMKPGLAEHLTEVKKVLWAILRIFYDNNIKASFQFGGIYE